MACSLHEAERTICAELDEELLGACHRTVSPPSEPGENQRVAVKIVAHRGIDSLEFLHLD